MLAPDVLAQFDQQRLEVLRLDGHQDGGREGRGLGDLDGAHAVLGGQVGHAFGMLLDDDDVIELVVPAQQPRQQGLADLAAAEDGQPVRHHITVSMQVNEGRT